MYRRRQNKHLATFLTFSMNDHICSAQSDKSYRISP